MLGEAASTVSLALGLHSLYQIAKPGLDELKYQKALKTLVDEATRANRLSASDREAIRRRLDKGSSDALVRELYACKTEAQFSDVLRRFGFPPGSVSPDTLRSLEKSLVEERFEAGARPQDSIMREEMHQRFDELAASQRDQMNRGDSERANRHKEVDPEVGTVAILVDDLGFPLIAEWSPRLAQALTPAKSWALYRDPLKAYAQAWEQAQGDGDRSNLQGALEDVVLLCVEREFEAALSRLSGQAQQVRHVAPHQQVLFYRLMGAVHRSLGQASGARRAYERARRLLTRIVEDGDAGSAVATSWLKRQLETDLLSLRLGTSDPFEDMLEESEQLHAIPAWERHPAVDEAVGAFSEELAEEWAQAAWASESTWRSSSRVEEAICHYNRALALSYMSGSFLAARDVRLQFVRSLAPHFKLETNRWLVDLAFPEVLATNDDRSIASFLSVHVDLLSGKDKWGEMVIGRLDSRDAEDRFNKVTLTLIEHMAPYFDDSTVETLNDKLFARTRRFLVGHEDELVRGSSYRESFFIDAYASVFRPKREQLLKVIETLQEFQAHETTGPFSFWNVLAQHRWQPDEAEAATGLVGFALTSDRADSSKRSPLLVSLLVRIAQTYPGQRSRVAEWLVQLAKEDAETYAPYVLFTGPYEEAVSDVRDWADMYLRAGVERLVKSNERGQVIYGGSRRPIAALPTTVGLYSECFSQETILSYVYQLLVALEASQSLATHKADAYLAVLGLVRLLEPTTRAIVETQVAELRPLEERTKAITFKGPWYSPNSDEAILVHLRLRLELGISLTTDELLVVVKALGSPANRATYSAACDVAESLIQSGVFQTSILERLFSMAFNEDSSVDRAARALRSLVRTLDHAPEPLRALIDDGFARLLDKGNSFILQTLFHEGKERWGSIPVKLREQLAAAASACQQHAHRQVRYWAGQLLQNMGVGHQLGVEAQTA